MNHQSGWMKTAGLIAALALILILAPAALADSYSDGLVTWTYSGGSITGAALASGVTSVGTLAIPEYVPSGSSYVPVTSVGGMSGIGTASVDTVIIPKYVTSIADNAFRSCANIKGFDFRCGSLNSIGSYAFYGITAMTSIDLPDSVTSIGNYAFATNTALKSIGMPDSLSTIGTYAFYQNSALASIDLPDSLTSIGEYAFAEDAALSGEIVIPDGVTVLNFRCFYKCSSLASVHLPDGLTSIGGACFASCSSLADVNFPSGLKTIGSSAFTACAITSVDLPDTITKLTNYAFSSCKNMTEATVRSGEMWIGVFSNCAALQKVTLGDGVTAIYAAVFDKDTSLTDLTVSADNPYFCSEGNIVYNKEKTALVVCSPAVSGAITIPDTVTTINYCAICVCPYLTSITLPSGLTTIGSAGIADCPALTRVVFQGACPTFDSPCLVNCSGSLISYYPVKYESSWSSFSLSSKQAYANITWELSDGSEAVTTMENVNSSLIAVPADPARDGYTFAGWFDGALDTAAKWDFAVNTVTDDLTLYAHWTAIPCTITFDSKGGSAIDPITADLGSTLTAPADPTWEGYIFLGWEPVFPSAMPAEGVVLTAKWTTIQCTITFDSNGGSAVDPMTAEYNSALTAPADPTREGYTFAGWDPAFPATMPANGATLTAQWTINQYTITFDSNGGSAVESITADYGTLLTLPGAPDKEGYYFLGWWDAANPWAMPPTTMPAGDMTLTAFWDPYPFAIFFDSNGGSEVDEIWADCGSALTKPTDPTREGYTFAGWDPAFPATMPANGATLMAQWTINRYTVNFDTSGGTSIDPLTVDYGTLLSQPAIPEKPGYTFIVWCTDPYGQGGWSFETDRVTRDITLYAYFEAIYSAIVFDTAGGNELDAISEITGTPVTPPPNPTREGYSFAGWNPAFPATMPGGWTVLTAQWTINQYTITFDSNGGSAVESITADYGSALTAPADPSREGYTFAGWNPAFPATMPANGATLTAQWTILQYTIMFDSNGGSAVDSITADYNSTLTAPEDPTREGYAFTGWSPAFPATMPVSGATLTAQWAILQYTIMFDSNGGSAVESVTADYGADLTMPDDPTREGYTFAGWEPSFPAKMPAYYDLLTAQWTINRYTITFDSNGGSAVESITADYGSALTAPEDPTREGYAFTGWSPAFPTKMPVNGAALTAQWTANLYAYSVVYYYNGTKDDSKTVSDTAAFGSSISMYPDKSIAGYALDHDTLPLVITADPAANVLSVYYVKDSVLLVEKVVLATANGFTVVYKGETVQLNADITPADADDQSLTWKSSNTKYATVSAQGIVTGKSAGKVKITAAAQDGSGVSGSITLTVAAPETSIKLSASSAVLYQNAETDALKTLQLTATASPKGTTYRGLTWSVFSGDAATVDASTGLVTAVNEGTAVIRATTDKGHSADCTITVRTLPTTFTLKTTEKTLAYKQSFDLGAEAVMDGTEPVLTWTTSNKKVATVSSSGVVTASKSVTGKATITATTKNGLKAACVVTVVKSLSKRTSNVRITKGTQLVVGLKLSGGDYATSNASVADVAKNGEVTLKKDGTATLEAGGKEITVKVSGGNPVSLTLCEGAELTLISEDVVKWTANDGKIAAVDAAGRLTAQREGTTTITGETQAGGAIEIKVVVKQPEAAQATPEPAQTDEPQLVLSEPEPSAEPAPAVEPSPSEEPEPTVEPTPSPEPEPTPKPEETPAPEPDPDPTPAPGTDSGTGA